MKRVGKVLGLRRPDRRIENPAVGEFRDHGRIGGMRQNEQNRCQK